MRSLNDFRYITLVKSDMKFCARHITYPKEDGICCFIKNIRIKYVNDPIAMAAPIYNDVSNYNFIDANITHVQNETGHPEIWYRMIYTGCLFLLCESL